MACDAFESLLDRVFARSKPGDKLIDDGAPMEWETRVYRTATGIRVDQIEWYPSMGGREWSEELDEASARARLRAMCTEDNPPRCQLEDRFPYEEEP